MSTVHEVIAAVHLGMRVAAVSAITNLAEGLGDEPLSHEQTLASAQPPPPTCSASCCASPEERLVMTDPIALLDLTSLNDDDTADTVRELCAKAVAAKGNVAAVCIMPAFIGVAEDGGLAGTGVKVATVANFPEGDDDPFGAADQVQFAIDAGADEVDVVVPWRAHVAGDLEVDRDARRRVRGAAPPGALKVILETGSLGGAAATRALADAALANGAAS